MARVIGSERTLEVLVNCKTYPAVSSKYIETVCTGGVTRDGSFARLYPIPFRLLDAGEQYNRWDIIRIRAYRDTKDQRPESWHLESGSPIEILGSVKSDKDRWGWMRPSVFESITDLEAKGRTNGLVEITAAELYWEKEARTWSASQLNVFSQGNLFHGEALMSSLSERVPWQFKLKFTEKSTGRNFDQKVLAWSYYQGFRREVLRGASEANALAAIRDRVNCSIMHPSRRVFAIFGTHSRFRHWMISGLYHLPNVVREQELLF